MIELSADLDLATLTLPAQGQATLLRGVFNAEEMAGVSDERQRGADRLIPYGRHRPGTLQGALEELNNAPEDFSHTINLVTKLGVLASTAGNYDQLLCIYAKMFGIAAHRDNTLGNPLTFITVTTGDVRYRFGGKLLLGKHYGKVQEEDANVGDVLCINNTLRVTRRPPHSATGNGWRLVADFFTTADLLRDSFSAP